MKFALLSLNYLSHTATGTSFVFHTLSETSAIFKLLISLIPLV